MSADELVRGLILRHFAARFETLPYSSGHHILHCDTRQVADVSHQDSFTCCESCPYVAFTARVSCEHAEVAFKFGESGRLPSILDDLAELAEAQEAVA